MVPAGVNARMNTPRNFLIAALAGTLAIWGAWHVYSGWGLVTLKVENAPISEVLASISKQGGIEIASNLAPATKVSLEVHRVPAVEALDIAAVRADASWRVAYLGAPDRTAIENVLGAFRSSGDTSGWTSHGRGGGFSFVEASNGQALDLRAVRWEPGVGGDLHAVLGDAAEKTGVLLAAPAEWKPSVSVPAAGQISQTAPKLFLSAGGTSREVFLVRGSPADGGPDIGEMGGRRGGSWIGERGGDRNASEGGGSGRGWGNPAGMLARAEAQIALLPAAEQEKAREDLSAMRTIWEEVRALPEDQRREKMREIMNRPEVADRMEQRRLAREAKMTPDQRIQRSKRYMERKAEAKASQGNNP